MPMDEMEVHDDVQQPPEVGTPEQTPPLSKSPSESEAKVEAPDDGTDEGQQRERKYIPKERFDQVYARGKDAEVKLQQAREEKARLEGELEAMKRQPAAPPPTPRYTEAQLQQMIDEGKATVGQVLAYQKETLAQELERKFEAKFTEKLASTTRTSSLQQEITKYKQTVPEVTQEGTPERVAVEREYAYLVNLGYDANDPRTELMAVRAALGSVETIQERRKAKSIPSTGRETMQDTHTSGNPKAGEKDILKTMTSAQRQHYQKMLDKGVYKGWDEVRDELKFAASYR